ncbi:BQ5605_C003g02376 [Microbotryum silenes-dioicae]|uniref:Large ribosomal subunit protein uL3m n=1 Tax=Microbotryum silenes-dioicae TaxID=796604 RepID=A0A2X0NYP9_9BASI|nr:BQ5605_C003g02376 [Microbotryum silenes-dioicae]
MQSLTSTLRSVSLVSRRCISSTSAATATSSTSPTATERTSTASDPVWTPYTKRTGVLARKLGMTALWQQGVRVPVTVLHLDDVQVIESRSHPATSKSPAHHSVIVGASPRKRKTTHNALLGQFKKVGVEPKMRLAEFEVTEDALVPSGTRFSAAHFVPGQHVDTQAPSIGKGFQGPMKRHGFKGLRASHGTSVSHRSHGSTGQHQDPGRVWPGKKMAGRMGGKNVTTQNLLVHRIDTLHNVLYVKGCVPGAPGGFVRVVDAKKKVGWKALSREKFGLGREEGEVLEGVKGLPMPAGSVEMVQRLGLPREVEVNLKVVLKDA